jgi:uncharacterized protein YbjQ (UPF0145 family)
MAKCTTCGKKIPFLETDLIYGSQRCAKCRKQAEKVAEETRTARIEDANAGPRRKRAETHLDDLRDHRSSIWGSTPRPDICLTTCQSIAGSEVIAHHGIVTAHVITSTGSNIMESIFDALSFPSVGAALSMWEANRTVDIERMFARGREMCLEELKLHVHTSGGNSAIGVTVTFGQKQWKNTVTLMVTAVGTAVTVTPDPPVETSSAVGA